MNIILSQPDPNDPQVDIESDRSRRARCAQNEQEWRAAGMATKRAARLDKYFSQHPPNGPTLSIYRDVLEAFVNSSGETPRWLTYPQLFASFERLEKRAVLKIEMTVDELNIRHYKSTSTGGTLRANRRNVRPPELDALVTQLKQDLGIVLDTPTLAERQPVHGCRYVPAINKWRVSLYFGGAQRALGCYSLSTALRLQDVLAFHFSSYRRPAAYNTSEAEARDLLTRYSALRVFAEALEAHWLAAGVIRKPVEIISTEQRLTVVEKSLAEINKKFDEVLRLVQAKAT